MNVNIASYARFAEDVVLPLHVVQPPAHTKEGLVGREEMTSFGLINETNGVQ
jgi:hypothetical protein